MSRILQHGNLTWHVFPDVESASRDAGKMSESSRNHPMLAGLVPPPAQGMTLGLADILNSRTLLLLVFGEEKQEALRRWWTTGLTTHLPASLLRLHHRVIGFCDEAAVATLPSQPPIL